MRGPSSTPITPLTGSLLHAGPQLGAELIDRRGSLLSGPFFSSEGFPWPQTEDFSWEPIVQLGLAFAGRVRGKAVGEGLVQVWKRDPRWLSQDPDGYEVRFIPAESAASDELQPLPTSLRCDHEASHAWRTQEAAAPPWFLNGLQITGVGAAEPSYNYIIEECLLNDLIEREQEYPDDLVARAQKVLDNFSGKSLIGGDYLFGNFYPIQFGAYITPLLLNLDTDHFRWGDEGSAQLFFTEGATDGGCCFYWSC